MMILFFYPKIRFKRKMITTNPKCEGGEETMFWNWLKKNHPVINEVVWWAVILMCAAVLFK